MLSSAKFKLNLSFLLLCIFVSGSTACTEFVCRNGNCVPQAFVCDGNDDCIDWSDELNCGIPEFSTEVCNSHEMKCSNGRCIPLSWFCDGQKDCFDGLDEPENCTGEECPGFLCNDKKCIMGAWHCDGSTDCEDGSDEDGCKHEGSSIDDNFCQHEVHFKCLDGEQCIDLELVCDEIAQCRDGSDEGPNCKVSHCESAGCSQHCHEAPESGVCYCDHGFTLQQDWKTCTDIDECERKIDVCSQICMNTIGSYTCSCVQGYAVYNMTGCKAKGEEPILIYSTSSEIRVVNLHSRDFISAQEGLQETIAVAYDGTDHQLYWNKFKNFYDMIVRSRKDGTFVEPFIISGIQMVEGLAVDWVARNLYFTDGSAGHILACSLLNAECALVVNGNVSRPRSLIVDPPKRLLYWTDWGIAPVIERAGMDGSERRPFVTTNLLSPNGLTIDHVQERLYWADAELNVIESIKLNGLERKIVLEGVISHPFSMALFEDSIYWTDWTHKTLETCNKVTGRRHMTIAKHPHLKPMGVSIYHPLLQPKLPNPCLSASCSHLCLLSPRTSYRCACPIGFKLNSNGKTCSEKISNSTMLVAIGNEVKQFHLKAAGSNVLRPLQIPGFVWISAMAYNPRSLTVYFADREKNQIVAVALNTLQTNILYAESMLKVDDMAFDYLAGNIYWVDYSRHSIEVLNVESRLHTKIVTIHSPLALDLVPTEGIMFVAVIGDSSSIQMMSMDGSNPVDVVKLPSMSPMSLVVDALKRKIYWSDATTKTIWQSSYQNHETKLIVEEGVALALQRASKKIFWININMEEVAVKIANTISRIPLKITNKTREATMVYLNDNVSPGSNRCSNKTHECSHICLSSMNGESCACPDGMSLTTNNKHCRVSGSCQHFEFACEDGRTCIPLHQHCDKHVDCPDSSDESDCHCMADEFQCDYGICLPLSYRCNKVKECPNGADEIACGCKNEQFQCVSDGKCIPGAWHCDRDPDCSDGSDETNCARNCTVDEFRCTSGICILRAWTCDGDNDCDDGLDEMHCVKEICEILEFTCKNGRCIDTSEECDGNDDCGDNSDEDHCPELATCPPVMYMCPVSRKCIMNKLVCDGYNDCPDYEDEMDCKRNCSSEEFRCSDDECVPKRWICDDEPDCDNHADEDPVMCHHTTVQPNLTACNNDQYRCKSGHCIPLSKACNYHPDCPDRSDEGVICELVCMDHNGGCSDVCIPTPTGPVCRCHNGFVIKNNRCEDVDECLEFGICSQYCINTKGSFKCTCEKGYALKSDHRSCKAEGGKADLLIAAKTSILRLSLDHQHLNLALSEDKSTIKAIDYIGDDIYWLDDSAGSIKRSFDDRTEEVVTRLNKPSTMSVDWIASNIYYWDRNGFIQVCRSTQKNVCAPLISTNEDEVNDIVIDATHGFIFWIVDTHSMMNETGRIMRAGMDGSNSKAIVNSKIVWPRGLVADLVLKYVYWVDHYIDCIETSNYYGDHRRTITHDAARPISLTIFEDHIYWYSVHHHAVMICDKFNCHHPTNFQHENVRVDALRVRHPSLHPQRQNPCAGVTCELCTLNPSSFTCFSPKSIDLNEKVITNPPPAPLPPVKIPVRPSNDSNCTLPCEHGQCVMLDGNASCVCFEDYTGTLCGVKAMSSAATATSNPAVGIIVALLIILIIAAILFIYYKRSRSEKPFRDLWDNIRASNLMNRASVIRFKTKTSHSVSDHHPIVSNDEYVDEIFQPTKIDGLGLTSTPKEKVEIEVYSADLDFLIDEHSKTDKKKLLLPEKTLKIK